jgi:trehalose 6-phosphate synthase
MARIVIVSNRVVPPRKAAQAGGVAVAIADILRGRDGLWFGWSGNIQEDVALDPQLETARADTLIATLPITAEEYNGYYLGYANSVLWPVFHNRVDLAQFEAGFYHKYKSVNCRFAAALSRLLRPDDVIWIHDYHFIPLAGALRALGVTNRIGFFLHIPFPPSQAMLAIPEHVELARSLAAYDLVGLQTTTDVANMIDYLEHGIGGRILPDGRIRVADRILAVSSFPVGISATRFTASRERIAATPKKQGLRRIIGVDRLDYTKGLPQKFRGFGRFLQQNPAYHNGVILTQIAAPTRESVEAYSDVRSELESLSGAINGNYSSLDWVPIHYINRSVARSKLPATYRVADVGLVTPLRDGMNLVAKEYVAAQDPQDPGVLVLSRFAGAAEQLTEALIVNPYNVDEIAAALRTALSMPATERRERHGRLLAKILADDASHWCASFLAHLDNTEGGHFLHLSAPASHHTRMKRAMKLLGGVASDPVG